MGICNSSESAFVTTAKLVFLDGAILEFLLPVTVSHTLDKNPTWFVCSSDEIEFDDFISSVDDDDELWQLQAEDMVALAVKASLSFKKGGGGVGDGERGRR